MKDRPRLKLDSRYALTCVVGLGVLLGFTGLARPQGLLQLSLAPMRVDVQHLKPGDSHTGFATVSNSSERPQHMVIRAADWLLNNQALPEYSEPGTWPAYSCSAWIVANPTEFDLAPGRSQRVRFTLSVPGQVSERGYHCALIFQTVPGASPGLQANTLRTQLRLVTTFYAAVGSPVPQPHVDSFSLAPVTDAPASGGGGTEKPKWLIQLTLSNTGNTHYRAEGSIKLFDGSEKLLETFSLESAPVLPETQRRFSWPFPGNLAPGEYRLHGIFDFGLKALQEIEKTITVSPSPGQE